MNSFGYERRALYDTFKIQVRAKVCFLLLQSAVIEATSHYRTVMRTASSAEANSCCPLAFEPIEPPHFPVLTPLPSVICAQSLVTGTT